MEKTTVVSRQTRLAIVGFALLSFCGILSETSMNVTFPTLMHVFHLPLETLQWITTGYLLSVAIVMTASAAIKKQFSERRIYFVAASLFILGSLLPLIHPGFGLMMVGRVLQGVATGINMPMMFNLIIERIPPNRIGTYMGLGGLIISLAPAIGPTYGGFIIAHLSWEWIFIFILPVVLISFFLVAANLTDSPGHTHYGFDIIGFLLLGGGLTALLLLINQLSQTGVQPVLLGITLLCLALFVIKSLCTDHPLLDLRVLKNKAILCGILPFFIFQFCNLGSNFIIPNYLILSHTAESTVAGMVLFPGTILGACSAPLVGMIYDAKGPRLSLYMGNVFFFLALAALSFRLTLLGALGITLVYVVFTLGRNFCFNNIMTVAVSGLPHGQTADATALFQMSQQFAGALGTALAALIANASPHLVSGVGHVFQVNLALVATNFVTITLLLAATGKLRRRRT